MRASDLGEITGERDDACAEQHNTKYIQRRMLLEYKLRWPGRSHTGADAERWKRRDALIIFSESLFYICLRAICFRSRLFHSSWARSRVRSLSVQSPIVFLFLSERGGALRGSGMVLPATGVMRQQGNCAPKMSGGRLKGVFTIRQEVLKTVAGWDTRDVARFLQKVK